MQLTDYSSESRGCSGTEDKAQHILSLLVRHIEVTHGITRLCLSALFEDRLNAAVHYDH